MDSVVSDVPNIRLRPPGWRSREIMFVVDIEAEGAWEMEHLGSSTACPSGLVYFEVGLDDVFGRRVRFATSYHSKGLDEADALRASVRLLESQPWAYPGILRDSASHSIQVRPYDKCIY